MGFFFLFLVCFLAQCAFQFADEHLLVFLISVLILLFFAVMVGFLQNLLHGKRAEVASSVLKSRFLNSLFFEELGRTLNDLEETTSTVFITNVAIFDALVPFVSDYYENLLALEIQNQVSSLLNEALTLARGDLSDDQFAILDITLNDFDEN